MDSFLRIETECLSLVCFANSETLTDDTVFLHDAQTDHPLKTQLDLQLTLGPDVRFNTYGISGRLAGQLRLMQQANSRLRATGELNIDEGQYEAYGQALSIDKGQLTFSGSPLFNPRLHLRALKSFKTTHNTTSSSDKLLDFSSANLQQFDVSTDTKVGLEATGHLRSPHIKLFSIPSTLSQADILSMLVLGMPASQVGNSGGKVLLNAIAALNLDNGSKGAQLMKQMHDHLGLDIGIDDTAVYDQQAKQTSDKHSVSIRKKLSNRLYASYRVGLFQENSNILTIKYLLNKFFSIQVNASESANGIDVLYTHRDK